MTETRPRRRRRWVVPALLLVGAGALVARRSVARPADDVWAPATRPAAAPAAPAPAAVPPAAPAATVTPAAADVPPVDIPAADGPAAAPAAGPAAGTTAGSKGAGRSSVAPLASAPPAVNTSSRRAPRPRRTVPAAAPYGPASAAAGPNGEAPAPEFTIKGNAGSKLFHPPSSPYYARTRAEVWFRTAEDAEAAGFTAYRPRGSRT